MISQLSKIRHLFFDLDHTLWDFEGNAKTCLDQIYHTHRISDLGVVNFDVFYSTFSEVNKHYWYLLDTKKISHQQLRRERFQTTLARLEVDISSGLSEAMNEQFMSLLPSQPLLMPYTLELLETLKPHFQLHILSNGFQQIQRQKMASGGILSYFDQVITHDIAQAHKPSPEIFTFAFNQANCSVEEALMIGDNWMADIEGALQMGMMAIHYDPDQEPSQEPSFIRISSLHQIPQILLPCLHSLS